MPKHTPRRSTRASRRCTAVVAAWASRRSWADRSREKAHRCLAGDWAVRLAPFPALVHARTMTMHRARLHPVPAYATLVVRLWVAAVGVLVLVAMALRPSPIFPVFLATWWWEAALHVLAWGLLTWLVLVTLPRGGRPPLAFDLLVFVFVMIVGVAVEVLQATVAGRDAELRDLVADAVGAAAALRALSLLMWFGGGRTDTRHGTWAPTSIVPVGVAAAAVSSGVLIGLSYLRHSGGGILGDAPPPAWALQRPFAVGVAAGLATLLVGRALVFFARLEAAVASPTNADTPARRSGSAVPEPVAEGVREPPERVRTVVHQPERSSPGDR